MHTTQSEQDYVLPAFRSDLKLFLGPESDDGSPTFTVHDPLKGDYWKISWPESLVLRYHTPGITAKSLAQLINTHTTCRVSEEDVLDFFKQAKGHHLLKEERTSDQLYGEWESSRKSYLSVLTNLFVRIPLLKPDRFLSKTLPYVLFLVSTPALILYAVLTLIGMGMVLQNTAHYFATFSYFFNFEGLLAYLATIAVVKTIHEFSHAYTARNYGVSVPTMGVLIVVIWPMLYTDITNSWRLWNRKQRIAITLAGVASELILAGITTFAWGISDPGVLKSSFFLVSSVTWITSLFINLNPAVKFDGYLLLSDLWGIDNLRLRSVEVIRWKILNGIFGYELENPEPALSKRHINGLFVYGIYTWIYRCFVYLYLAYFVYTHLTKVFGIVFSFLIMWNYLIYPVVMEVTNFRKKKYFLKDPWRFQLSSLIIGVVFFVVIFPLPRTISVEGITVPVVSQVIYAPSDTVIQEIFVEKGAEVKKGEPLLQLYSPSLEFKLLEAKNKVREVDAAIQTIRLVEKIQDFFKTKLEEQKAARINLEKIETQVKKLKILATVNGKVSSWERGLKTGLPVKKGQVLFQIVDENQIKVVGFVPGKQIQNIHLDQEAKFCLNHHRNCYFGKVDQIFQVRKTLLDQPQMASAFGGKLLTTEVANMSDKKKAVLIDSFYTIDVYIEASANEMGFGQRGYINISAGWRSIFFDWLKHFYGLLIRESGI